MEAHPWWVSFTFGFSASIIGQVLIGTVAESIGTDEVTRVGLAVSIRARRRG